MTLKNLTENICELAKSEKLINFAMAGTSIYQLNPKTIENYPVLFVAPTGDHLVRDNTTTYVISLTYLDRLLEDDINSIDIYSSSIEELKNLIRKIETIEGVVKVEEDYTITNWADTESFNDRLCGSFCTISIVTVNTFICPVD